MSLCWVARGASFGRQAKGKQKPERFEGGTTEVLRNSLSQQVGLSMTASQTNAEPFEINAVY